jgi:uncharacterized protein
MTMRKIWRRAAAVAVVGSAVAIAALTSARAEIDLLQQGSVPLTVAAAKGETDKVHGILLTGTSPNLTDPSGRPALGWAALGNHTGVIEELLKAPRILIDAKDRDGNTALILASQRGNEEAVALLIKAKARLNLDNRDGMTALSLAAQNGFVRIVEMLVKAGADTTIQDRTGRTPLEWAQDNNKQRVVDFLKSQRKS